MGQKPYSWNEKGEIIVIQLMNPESLKSPQTAKHKHWRLIAQVCTVLGIGTLLLWGCNSLLTLGFRCTRTIATEQLLKGNFGKGVNYSLRTTYFVGSMCGAGQDFLLVRFSDGKEVGQMHLLTKEVESENPKDLREVSNFTFLWQPPKKLIVQARDVYETPENRTWHDVEIEYKSY